MQEPTEKLPKSFLIQSSVTSASPVVFYLLFEVVQSLWVSSGEVGVMGQDIDSVGESILREDGMRVL